MGISCPSEVSSHLGKLRGFFASRAVPSFLVGGCIRDSLLDVPPRDLDIAVVGDSLSLARELANVLGGSFVPIAEAHSVARVVVPSPLDGRWTIDLSGVEGSIDQDLGRRDFTMNAMALSLGDWDAPDWEGRVIDPFGGREDLSRRAIRVTGPSVFSDDPARLLRAVRLSAALGFSIEASTAQLIARQAGLITSVPGERASEDFLAILSLDSAKMHLEILDDLGLLCSIIPELEVTRGVGQPKEHYWDVFSHSVHSVEAMERVTSGRQDDPICATVPWSADTGQRFAQEVSHGHNRRTFLKLGALLHDIAKPQTKAVDAKGRTRFLGHHTMGAAMSRKILRRLRMASRAVEMVGGLVEHHLRPMQMSQGSELPTARAVYRYFRDTGDVAIDTLYLSMADHLAARGPGLDVDDWRHHTGLVAHTLQVGTQEQAPKKLPRLVSGHDLMRDFGLAPGPLIGSLLEEVRDAQAAGEVGTTEEALAWVKSRLEGLGG